MSKSSFVSWTLGAGFGVVALWAAPAALAGEVRIDGGACASAVHLVARDAPLSDVLKRLAQALDFQLSFKSESNPIVSVDAMGEATDLVARLVPLANVSLTQTPNPRCPERERIVTVWVLPSGQGSPMPVAAASQPAQQAQAEQSRRQKEGIDQVLKSHGMAPAPEAETESPPEGQTESQ